MAEFRFSATVGTVITTVRTVVFEVVSALARVKNYRLHTIAPEPVRVRNTARFLRAIASALRLGNK